MRVLHLSKTNRGGDFVLRLVEQLQLMGVANCLALPAKSEGGMAQRFTNVGAQVVDLECSTAALLPHNIRGSLARIRELISNTQPDLVHSHFFAPAILTRLALRKNSNLPRIFQVPGPLHLESPHTRMLDTLSSGPEDYVIATCLRTQQIYLKDIGLPPERVFLSYYGVDVHSYQPVRTGKLRRELGLLESTPLVGMVAWMYPPKIHLGHLTGVKGHEDFIRAVAILRRRFPALRAVVIGGQWGNGRWYETYLRAAGNLLVGDAIAFIGPRNDVSEIYPDLDAAAHPSRSENVGGAVESLLYGVPTVSYEVGGLVDVVRDAETGLLVPPGRPDLLAGALAQLLGNRERAKAMATAGRALALSMFDVASTASQVLEIYRTVLSGRARAGGSR